MLYLKQERLVFIHIPRTGGHSVYEMCLGKFLAYRGTARKGFAGQRVKKLGAHATAVEVRDAMRSLPPWKSAYKFSIVRDPIDRLISSWRRLEKSIPLATYIDNLVSDWDGGRLITQDEMLTDRGKIIIDKVFRFDVDMEQIRQMIDSTIARRVTVIPHIDSCTQPGDRETAASEDIDRIRNLYRDDYDRWGSWWD